MLLLMYNTTHNLAIFPLSKAVTAQFRDHPACDRASSCFNNSLRNMFMARL